MNISSTDKKPCLVQTPQGFSIEYQNKYLYSKYNPSKNIDNLINNLQLLPGTIILCFSPLLEYGIDALLNKLPANCILIFCEFNSDLHDYIQNNNKFLTDKKIIFPDKDELLNLPIYISEKNHTFTDGKTIKSGFYKRICRIDFSAGIQFNLDLYKQLEAACINSIKTFWINRITLTKFGKKFSYNLFANLSILPYTTPIKNYFNSICKPIIVCGAGESLQHGLNDFKNFRNNYFILCADTAASFLIHNDIIPDGVFIEEAQNVILKAFFDINKNNIHVFSGLSSISSLSHNIDNKKNISFFATEYTKNDFINNLKKQDFFPDTNPPFGSVGLTMVYYALLFRNNDNIPIYIYGLDFSYSKGITHVKNSIALKERELIQNKFISSANFSSNYSPNTIIINENLYTSIVMENYAKLFNSYFSDRKNLFDSRNSGLTLEIPLKKPEINLIYKNLLKQLEYETSDKLKIKNYFEDEIKQLIKLKFIFTNQNNYNLNKTKDEINSEIISILYQREYLYLHFIDGYQISLNIDFLNRVRSEIDYFLKEFNRLVVEIEYN